MMATKPGGYESLGMHTRVAIDFQCCIVATRGLATGAVRSFGPTLSQGLSERSRDFRNASLTDDKINPGFRGRLISHASRRDGRYAILTVIAHDLSRLSYSFGSRCLLQPSFGSNHTLSSSDFDHKTSRSATFWRYHSAARKEPRKTTGARLNRG